MSELTRVDLRNPADNQHLAQIGLNGYQAKTNIPARHNEGTKRIWSFKILKGSTRGLTDFWLRQSKILLCGRTGKSVYVRVVAMPIDNQSFGMIEFCDAV